MAAVYKRGDAWYLDYRDAHGRQRRSLGDITKKEAEAALAAKEYELRTGHNLTAAHNSAPQFALFAEAYLRWFGQDYPTSYNRRSEERSVGKEGVRTGR